MVELFTQLSEGVDAEPVHTVETVSEEMNEPSMEALFFVKQFAHNYGSVEGMGDLKIAISLN